MEHFKCLEKGISILITLILILLPKSILASEKSNSTFSTSIQLKNSSGKITNEFLNGEPITFLISIQNSTSVSQSLSFGNSQRYDVQVNLQNGKGAPMWNWAYEKMFSTVTGFLTFAPNEIKTFSVTWNQKDNSGSLIGQGSFQCQGIIVSSDNSSSDLQSNYLPFTIQIKIPQSH